MASLVQPSWTELQWLDEITISAINIVKGEMNGDEFLWDHEEEDEEGVISKGIWKSTLDARKKRNSGRILEQEED